MFNRFSRESADKTLFKTLDHFCAFRDGFGKNTSVCAAVSLTNDDVLGYVYERLVGRFARKPVKHPETGEVLVDENELIDEDKALEIVEAGIEEVWIRSAFTCNTSHGVCKRCYGRNLATGTDVEVGEAVGIIAAQSIGVPSVMALARIPRSVPQSVSRMMTSWATSTRRRVR